MNKKKLISVALVVIMIAILSFSTLAWFNDSDSVSNQFYVADSTDTSPDDIFSVDVYEKVDTDGDGQNDEKEDAGLVFENVVPGQTLPKAPVVENTGKYDQWVKLTITFSSTAAWDVLSDGADLMDLLTLAADFDTNWKEAAPVATVDGAYVYTFYLKNPLKAGATVDVFTAVNIPSVLDQTDFFSIKDEKITLDIKAEAIQLELGDTVEAAFAALNP